ncbi:uncharacterized protein LOC141911612 [Tubulanus polymorphus]|uniref:uncharacterized protein LOC141911612 n=1 Tax=Tubulanus polymorphus TaxID=672921 RepID=UPI003DA2C1F2
MTPDGVPGSYIRITITPSKTGNTPEVSETTVKACYEKQVGTTPGTTPRGTTPPGTTPPRSTPATTTPKRCTKTVIDANSPDVKVTTTSNQQTSTDVFEKSPKVWSPTPADKTPTVTLEIENKPGTPITIVNVSVVVKNVDEVVVETSLDKTTWKNRKVTTPTDPNTSSPVELDYTTTITPDGVPGSYIRITITPSKTGNTPEVSETTVKACYEKQAKRCTKTVIDANSPDVKVTTTSNQQTSTDVFEKSPKVWSPTPADKTPTVTLEIENKPGTPITIVNVSVVVKNVDEVVVETSVDKTTWKNRKVTTPTDPNTSSPVELDYTTTMTPDGVPGSYIRITITPSKTGNTPEVSETTVKACYEKQVGTSPGTTPPGTTPPGTIPPGTTSPGTTPPGTTLPGTTPPGTTPPGSTPATTTPKRCTKTVIDANSPDVKVTTTSNQQTSTDVFEKSPKVWSPTPADKKPTVTLEIENKPGTPITIVNVSVVVKNVDEVVVETSVDKTTWKNRKVTTPTDPNTSSPVELDYTTTMTPDGVPGSYIRITITPSKTGNTPEVSETTVKACYEKQVGTSPGTTPPRTTPPGTIPPGTTSPGTTPPGTTLPGTTPPGTTPPGSTPATTTPLHCKHTVIDATSTDVKVETSSNSPNSTDVFEKSPKVWSPTPADTKPTVILEIQNKPGTPVKVVKVSVVVKNVDEVVVETSPDGLNWKNKKVVTPTDSTTSNTVDVGYGSTSPPDGETGSYIRITITPSKTGNTPEVSETTVKACYEKQAKRCTKTVIDANSPDVKVTTTSNQQTSTDVFEKSPKVWSPTPADKKPTVTLEIENKPGTPITIVNVSVVVKNVDEVVVETSLDKTTWKNRKVTTPTDPNTSSPVELDYTTTMTPDGVPGSYIRITITPSKTGNTPEVSETTVKACYEKQAKRCTKTVIDANSPDVKVTTTSNQQTSTDVFEKSPKVWSPTPADKTPTVTLEIENKPGTPITIVNVSVVVKNVDEVVVETSVDKTTWKNRKVTTPTDPNTSSPVELDYTTTMTPDGVPGSYIRITITPSKTGNTPEVSETTVKACYEKQVGTSPGTTPPGTTPPGTIPPGTTSPGTTPPGTTLPGTTPPGTTPPGSTPATTTPKRCTKTVIDANSPDVKVTTTSNQQTSTDVFEKSPKVWSPTPADKKPTVTLEIENKPGTPITIVNVSVVVKNVDEVVVETSLDKTTWKNRKVTTPTDPNTSSPVELDYTTTMTPDGVPGSYIRITITPSKTGNTPEVSETTVKACYEKQVGTTPVTATPSTTPPGTTSPGTPAPGTTPPTECVIDGKSYTTGELIVKCTSGGTPSTHCCSQQQCLPDGTLGNKATLANESFCAIECAQHHYTVNNVTGCCDCYSPPTNPPQTTTKQKSCARRTCTFPCDAPVKVMTCEYSSGFIQDGTATVKNEQLSQCISDVTQRCLPGQYYEKTITSAQYGDTYLCNVHSGGKKCERRCMKNGNTHVEWA